MRISNKLSFWRGHVPDTLLGHTSSSCNNVVAVFHLYQLPRDRELISVHFRKQEGAKISAVAQETQIPAVEEMSCWTYPTNMDAIRPVPTAPFHGEVPVQQCVAAGPRGHILADVEFRYNIFLSAPGSMTCIFIDC